MADEGPSGELHVGWLGHSTVVLDLDGVRLIADPLLRPNAGPLRRRFPTPELERYEHPDAVLISHLHHDHAELSSLRRLPRVPVITATDNAAWLRRRGLEGRGLEEEWTTVADRLEVRLSKAVHGDRPMPHRPNQANGHLVRGSRWRIWVLGDTSLFDEMAEIPELLGGPPDLAVVPIAGWGPRLSGGHMGPREAAVACARTGALRVLPVHWGTLHPPFMNPRSAEWMDLPHAEFLRALPEEAPDCELVDLMPGEHTTLA